MIGLAKTDHFKLITMNDNSILIEKKDGILWMTINRPEKLNALNSAVLDALKYCIADLQADNHIKGAILTGSGEKAFVAGADIKEFADFSVEQGRLLSALGQKLLFDFVENMSKPVIAAVNGFALGGGLELAMACHMRIASDNAKMGLPEVTLGVIPGYGGTQRLAQLVGKGKAMEMITTAGMISAAEALHWGLVNAVVTQAELMGKASELARKIASNSPTAVSAAIRSVNAGFKPGGNGFNEEIREFGRCFGTADFRFTAIGYGEDGLMARLADGPEMHIGDVSDLAVKLAVARSVLRRGSDKASYIDVTVPTAPVLRERVPDAGTVNAPVANPKPLPTSSDTADWIAGAAPAESIRTLFG
jgi:enoyl-CoA hydratase